MEIGQYINNRIYIDNNTKKFNARILSQALQNK